MSTVELTIRVPAELHTQLREQARKTDMSIAQITRRSLTAYLALTADIKGETKP